MAAWTMPAAHECCGRTDVNISAYVSIDASLRWACVVRGCDSRVPDTPVFYLPSTVLDWCIF